MLILTETVPCLHGHHQTTGECPPIDLEHVWCPRVYLTEIGCHGRHGHTVDHAGLKARHNVLGFQRNWLEAIVLVNLDHLRATGPTEQFTGSHFINGLNGIGSEEVNPTGMRPAQNFEAFFLQHSLKVLTQLLHDMFYLIDGSKDHRCLLQPRHSRLNLSQASYRQQPHLELAAPHATDHFCLPTQAPIRINTDGNASTGRPFPGAFHGLEMIVIGRTFGNQGSQSHALCTQRLIRNQAAQDDRDQAVHPTAVETPWCFRGD